MSQKLPQSNLNAQISTSCSRGVDELPKRCNCGEFLIKNGRTKYGNQRFLCKKCRTSRVQNPVQNGYGGAYDLQIAVLTKEGLGIRSIARVLGLSATTVIRRILYVAESLIVPQVPAVLGRIQVDELHTFVQSKKKEVYVIYSWDQESSRALSLVVGRRSKTNLKKVIHPLLESEVEKINTDGYSGYKGVVPKKKHTTIKRRNNGIERQNLNLRTHLKRLNRRTICYSKSLAVLTAVVKICFWH